MSEKNTKSKFEGFIVFPTYKVINDKAYVFLYGRLKSGDSFVSINEFKPYFFIETAKVDEAQKIVDASVAENAITGDYSIEQTDSNNFSGEKMSKIILSIPRDVSALRRKLEEASVKCYEADVRFEYRFMIDMGIQGVASIIGEAHSPDEIHDMASKTDESDGDTDTFSAIKNDVFTVDKVFLNPSFESADFEPDISVLSFDIETDMTSQKIFSIALYFSGKNLRKISSSTFVENLILNKKKVEGAKNFETEKALLLHFADIVKKLDPDLITGWNVVDFDFRVLKDKFKEHRIDFDIGRVSWKNELRISHDFMRESKAEIPGRMVVDGISILKNNFIRLTDYKLDTAASEVIDDRKLITESEDKGEEIERLFRENPEKLVKYNAKDAKLVIDILNRKKLIELIVKRSILTGMPLDRVQASVATLDSLYLRKAKERNLVCSSVMDNDKGAPGKGGYVMEPKAGIYENVLVFDFKSLYPSIMITFNIDPISLLSEEDAKKLPKNSVVEAPNGAYFSHKEGILPGMIREKMEHREEMKKKKDDVASYAIKIIMNSFYGALGNPGCRFFSMTMTNAITSFGQYIIQNTAKEMEKKGFDVLYSDTDSVFINSKMKDSEKAEKKGRELEKDLNNYYDKWIKENYHRDSELYLEFEKNYLKIIFPRQRGMDKGAKKRYAGILVKDGEEKMDFTGLEFVRRDWTELSKKFQLGLLDRVFHEKPVIDFVKNFLEDIKKGEYDDLMVYVKGLRKDVASYTKTTPPHVKAAKKLDKIDSNIIKYVITTEGPEPIQKVKHPLDYEHYIDKQIRPIADSILGFYDTSLEELSNNSKQKDLFDY